MKTRTPPPHTYVFLAMLVTCALTWRSEAAVRAWSGLGGTDNWSRPGNWAGGIPGVADAVWFVDDDATGTSGSFGSANNIVDSSVAVQSLRYSNTNNFHTTQIPSGQTLTLSGGASPIVLVGTDTDNGNAQIVYATITLSGSNLLVPVPTVSGYSYVLQSATNLAAPISWSNESTNAGTGATLPLSVPIEPGKPLKFIRVWVY